MTSAVLIQDIDAYAAELRRNSVLLRSARDGKLPAAALSRYVSSIHFLLLHTPVHLTLAAGLAEASGEGRLAAYFRLKLAEECGHHEWAATDLERLRTMGLGHDTPEGPTRPMCNLVEGTRRAIEQDPYLYLGYILFAEYFTVVMGPEWLTALEKGCGVPRSAMSAIGRHVELDQYHVAAGCQEIDELIQDPRYLEPLRGVLRQTMRNFDRFCANLCEAA